MPTRIQKYIETAIRDICSVSVTAAPKSKVRKIIVSLVEKVKDDERENILIKLSPSCRSDFEIGESEEN